jgi:hypothetical protein
MYLPRIADDICLLCHCLGRWGEEWLHRAPGMHLVTSRGEGLQAAPQMPVLLGRQRYKMSHAAPLAVAGSFLSEVAFFWSECTGGKMFYGMLYIIGLSVGRGDCNSKAIA